MTITPNSIINGDCLEVMRDIDDRSIDCIICDLPYGVTNCAWDVVIPFDLLWEQYKRIIKPNGAIVLFGSQPFTSALVMSNPKWFKYEWIWIKNNVTGLFLAKKQPLRNVENILIFSNGTTFYNRQMVKRTNEEFKKAYRVNDSTKGRSQHYTSKKIRQSLDRQWFKPPTQTLFFNADKKRDGNSHPTQKPVALIEYLIKTYTLENELILDNTAGSGTLAIAAINTNRRYICIEKDPHYFEVMRDRIANHDPNAPIKTKKPKAATKGQLTLF